MSFIFKCILIVFIASHLQTALVKSVSNDADYYDSADISKSAEDIIIDRHKQKPGIEQDLLIAKNALRERIPGRDFPYETEHEYFKTKRNRTQPEPTTLLKSVSHDADYYDSADISKSAEDIIIDRHKRIPRIKQDLRRVPIKNFNSDETNSDESDESNRTQSTPEPFLKDLYKARQLYYKMFGCKRYIKLTELPDEICTMTPGFKEETDSVFYRPYLQECDFKPVDIKDEVFYSDREKCKRAKCLLDKFEVKVNDEYTVRKLIYPYIKIVPWSIFWLPWHYFSRWRRYRTVKICSRLCVLMAKNYSSSRFNSNCKEYTLVICVMFHILHACEKDNDSVDGTGAQAVTNMCNPFNFVQ